MARKHPNQGGCWFCHQDDGEMNFSCEFDCYFHEKCLLKALENKNDIEASIIAKEIGLVRYEKC